MVQKRIKTQIKTLLVQKPVVILLMVIAKDLRKEESFYLEMGLLY